MTVELLFSGENGVEKFMALQSIPHFICQGLSNTRRMKLIYPNLSLIGVNSTLNLLSFDVRLNVSIEKSRDTSKR
jgi:hypothetical protein